MPIIHRMASASGEDVPDRTVVAEVLDGQRERYALLVARYRDDCFRYALGMVGEGDAAGDMVQDAFVTAYERLAECRKPARFRAWLFQILRNRCLDHLKAYRQRNVSLDPARHHPATATTPEDDLERSLIGGAISTALAGLPEILREAFILKHVQDLSYDEMAEVTGASESALKMRVKRAREQLADGLAREHRM